MAPGLCEPGGRPAGAGKPAFRYIRRALVTRDRLDEFPTAPRKMNFDGPKLGEVVGGLLLLRVIVVGAGGLQETPMHSNIWHILINCIYWSSPHDLAPALNQ